MQTVGIVRSALIALSLTLLTCLPSAAMAAAPAPGVDIESSDHSGLTHVVAAWPEASGNLTLDLEAIESPTTPVWRIYINNVAGEGDPGVQSPCTYNDVEPTGADYIECPVTDNAELHNGIEIWTGDGNDMVTVNSGSAAGAPAAIFLRDSTSTQTAWGGSGTDYFNTDEDDDTATGTNFIQGGGGNDSYAFSSNGIDILDYRDSARGSINPVTVTLDCVANDGNFAYDGGFENAGCTAQGLNGLQGSDGHDSLEAGASSGDVTIWGKGGNDAIVGGPGQDKLHGGNGDDTITGGAGHDQVDGDDAGGGGTGADTLKLRDGLSDQVFSCGGGSDSLELDDAATDSSVAADCETLDRPSGAGTPPAVIDPTKSLTLPDFRPKKKGSGYRFTGLKAAKKTVAAAGINLDFRVLSKPLSKVPQAMRESIEDGDVFSQSPAPGSTLTSALAQPFPLLALSVYSEALDYRSMKCPYKSQQKMKEITNAIEGLSLSDAKANLNRWRCNPVVVKEIVVKGASDSTIRSAWLLNKKSRKGRVLGVALMVERPPRQDFRINLTERAPSDLVKRPDFKNEIGLGVDGKLTAGRAPAVVRLDLREAVTGRELRSLSVKLIRTDGKVLGSTKTGATSDLTFTIPVDFTGDIDIVVEVVPANAKGSEVLEAWHSIDVVDRKQKPFYTKSGRYFKWSSSKGRYLPSKPPTAPSKDHDKLVERMLEVVNPLKGRDPKFDAAATILMNSVLTPQQRLAEVSSKLGLLPGALLGGLKPDGKIQRATLTTLPAVQLTGSGLLPTTVNAALLPKIGDVDTATLIGQDGGSLIGLDGGSLIGPDGGSLIGLDGGSLIGLDGGSLTKIGGSNVLGSTGVPLQSGMKVISDYTGGLTGGPLMLNR